MRPLLRREIRGSHVFRHHADEEQIAAENLAGQRRQGSAARRARSEPDKRQGNAAGEQKSAAQQECDAPASWRATARRPAVRTMSEADQPEKLQRLVQQLRRGRAPPISISERRLGDAESCGKQRPEQSARSGRNRRS